MLVFKHTIHQNKVLYMRSWICMIRYESISKVCVGPSDFSKVSYLKKLFLISWEMVWLGDYTVLSGRKIFRGSVKPVKLQKGFTRFQYRLTSKKATWTFPKCRAPSPLTFNSKTPKPSDVKLWRSRCLSNSTIRRQYLKLVCTIHCEFVVKSKVRSCDRKNIFQYLCFICTSSRKHISSCSVSNIQCSGAKMAHVHRNLNPSSTPHIPTHLNSPAGYPGIQLSASLGIQSNCLGE